MTVTTDVPVEPEAVGIDSESSKVEARLRSVLLQLRVEAGVFDRMVYKNKNQHRRSSYFQYLLKVRSYLRLLLSAELGDILRFLFHIVDEKKPAYMALFPVHSRKKNSRIKYNYQERLLGIARLLSQMTEPILKAAVQLSLLLAKSFFAGFCITILALLARLRVLVQQMLLDVVFIFNKVSSLTQEKQDVKITLDGLEAFREYYPAADNIVKLECQWEVDKFVLHEKRCKTAEREQNEILEDVPSTATVQYETLDLFSEGLGTKDDTDSLHNIFGAQDDLTENAISNNDLFAPEKQTDSSAERLQIGGNDATESDGSLPHENSNVAVEGIIKSNVFALPRPESISTNKKVAFITVKRASPSDAKENESCKKTKLDLPSIDEKEGSIPEG